MSAPPFLCDSINSCSYCVRCSEPVRVASSTTQCDGRSKASAESATSHWPAQGGGGLQRVASLPPDLGFACFCEGPRSCAVWAVACDGAGARGLYSASGAELLSLLTHSSSGDTRSLSLSALLRCCFGRLTKHRRRNDYVLLLLSSGQAPYISRVDLTCGNATETVHYTYSDMKRSCAGSPTGIWGGRG